MAKKEKTYNNLLDVCLHLSSTLGGEENTPEGIFRVLLREYFFQELVENSRKLEGMLDEITVPQAVTSAKTIFDVDSLQLDSEISGETLNDSFSGSILLSTAYIKTFYPHSAPSFGQLPDDDKQEVMNNIKHYNSVIVQAFEKMHNDIEADKNRTVLTLVALIIKNIHKKSGRKLGKPDRPIKEILSGLYQGCDEVFTASPRQMGILKDDSNLKELVKVLFPIKQFKEMQEIADMFKEELSRYERRALMISSRESE